MRKKEIEASLVNVRKLIAYAAEGKIHHLEDGEATIWVAGRNDEYVIKAFKYEAKERAKPEFEKLQKMKRASTCRRYTVLVDPRRTMAWKVPPSLRSMCMV